MHSVRAQNHRNATVVADLKLQLLTLEYNNILYTFGLQCDFFFLIHRCYKLPD